MSDFQNASYRAIMEGDFSDRIHQMSPDTCTFEAALQQMEAWREAGNYTVFNAGTYDILTLNHTLSLVKCRVLGAMGLLGIDTIETPKDRLLAQEMAATDSVSLMITLDTNPGIEASKSRRPEKGGAPKPTLDWSSRAAMLAMQSIPAPGYATRRQSVDYITRHGPDCCSVCMSGTCVNEDNARIVVELRPDLVLVNADSKKTVADLQAYQERGLLPDTQIALNYESRHQYSDPVLGGPISTTLIIERARS